jgi:hypothetical protein
VASASCNSPGPRADVAQTAQVDELNGDREHDRPEDTLRQILERARQEDEHERDNPGSGQVRELASPAGGLDHRGLRRAAVHDKRSADRRRNVGR